MIYGMHSMMDGMANSSTYGMDFTKEGLCRSLELVKEAVCGEKEDAIFYEYLIKKAPTKEQKEIISSIRDDEINHRKWFKEIYKCYMGVDAKGCSDEDFKKPKSYEEGIRKAIFGELKALEKYRIIRSGIPSRCYRDLVLEIFTDEIKHAIKYEYILTTLCCCKGMHRTLDEEQVKECNEDSYLNDMRTIMW